MRVAADYDIALRTVAKGVTEQFRIEHSPAGVERLIERCLALEPDPPPRLGWCWTHDMRPG
jgi:hypothetical protein